MINTLTKYRVLDVLIWSAIFFLWREYYFVVDPPRLSWVFATISTTFAGVTFYFTYLYLVPVIWNRKGVKWFIISVIITLIILAPVRTGIIYVVFETTFPGYSYWRFFNSITASSFHVGYAITIATLVRLLIDKYEIQKKVDAITKDNLQTELNYLKSQVNPHFLFNIHNSIYFLIEQNPKRAAEVLMKLSEIMKFQLYDCNKETIALSHEIDNIRNYIELEKMRVEEAVHVEFQSNIIQNGQQIAPFMLLPLIENTFKHVSQDGNKENQIEIRLSQDGSFVHLHTTNTMDPSRNENSTGLGLRNIKRRLELLYPARYELNTNITGDMYETSLKLKL